jgi:hypothetical protein
LNFPFKHLIQAIAPTGSRYICDPAPTDTDEDYVVLVLPEDFDDLILKISDNGYDLGGSDVFAAEEISLNEWDGFQSWKKGDINLIITTSKEFFDKFVEATEIAKELNLLQKEDRITVFQKILYNNDPIPGIWMMEGV